MARVLVTGGAGFIGSHLVDRFLARGDDVWVIDDLSTGRAENVPRQARFECMSIQDPALQDVFRAAGGFDIVSHHAAQVDVRRSVADPRADCAINLDGLLNVLECAREWDARRFLFVSSGGVVYGEPTVRPTPEGYRKRPLSPYGVSKLAGEHYLDCYHMLHGLDTISLRYANVYGPRQDPHGEAGVVAIFCNRLLSGESLTVFGDGEQTRDYVFVGDVVEASIILSDAELHEGDDIDRRAFNVGTGQETSVNALANALMSACGRSVEVVRAEARAGELRNACLDTGKLRALGWHARTSLDQGLRTTYEHIAGGRR
jgi:UDP-glucose 4-epimerase